MKRRPLTRLARVRIFNNAGGICHVCQLKIHAERGERWEAEHIVALADGGSDTESNMAPAHKHPCHRDKTDREAGERSKVIRQRANHLGIPKPTKAKFACGRESNSKKKLNGGVVPRTSQISEHHRVMAEKFGR